MTQHGLRPLLCALALAGCLLEETPCGAGLRRVGGECVAPADDTGTLGADLGSDATPPEEAADVADAFAEVVTFGALLVLDRTPAQSLAETPTTAGCDVDAVSLEGADGVGLAFAARVFADDILDPFGQGVGLDVGAALGAPEGDGRPSTFVSLGGSGGFLLLGFDAPRPLAAGDRVRVFEVDESSLRDRADRCAVWRCPERVADLTRCVFLGDVTDDAAVELR